MTATLWWGIPPGATPFHAKDSLSGEDVPLGGVLGHNGDFLQTQTITKAPLRFEAKGTGIVAGGESEATSTKRGTALIAKVLTSLDESVGVRIILADVNEVRVIGAEVTLNPTGILEGEKYQSEIYVADTFGSMSAKIIITTLSGSADVWLASV